MIEVGRTVVIVLVVMLFAIIVGCCCHFSSLKRREELAARRRSQRQTVLQPAGNGNGNQNNRTSPVYIFRLQGARTSNSTVIAREHRSNPFEGHANRGHAESLQSPDTIVVSGPPSYSCLAASNEPPPPSYEEVVRAST